MGVKEVKEYFKGFGIKDRVRELEESSATVELAAKALNCEPARIAKTLSFLVNDEPILIVAAGDTKISNPKFKEFFGVKARMLKPDQAVELIGHPVGGVCPFGVKDGVKTYLDSSLKRFETVYPACGSSNSMIELSLEELEKFANSLGWIEVTK